MARDILGHTATRKESRASHGGEMTRRDVMNYEPPRGPTNIHDPHSPGLHGDNHGTYQKCEASRGGESGKVGLHDPKIHHHGSQGHH